MRSRPLLVAAVCAALAVAAVRAAGPPADAVARFDAVALDGTRWTAERLQGRITLIDFWATWCAPCLAELPRLQALRSRYPREDFEILGINLDAGSRRSLISWLNRHRIDWPQVHEPRAYGGDAAQLFHVDRLPMTILVGRDGRVDAIGLRGARLAARVSALVDAPAEHAR